LRTGCSLSPAAAALPRTSSISSPSRSRSLLTSCEDPLKLKIGTKSRYSIALRREIKEARGMRKCSRYRRPSCTSPEAASVCGKHSSGCSPCARIGFMRDWSQRGSISLPMSVSSSPFAAALERARASSAMRFQSVRKWRMAKPVMLVHPGHRAGEGSWSRQPPEALQQYRL